tara:strand:- start:57 stop:947 length:891 start_codon:yes stop_codon:yes gene_type:complete
MWKKQQEKAPRSRAPATELDKELEGLDGRLVYTASGRKMGVVSRGTFTKFIKGSEHLLRKPPAIAYDSLPFDTAIKNSCKNLVVVDVETGEEYRTTVAEFISSKFSINRGFGEQYALSLSMWEKGLHPEEKVKSMCHGCSQFFVGTEDDFLCEKCRTDIIVLRQQEKKIRTGTKSKKRSQIMKRYWRYKKWYDKIKMQQDLVDWVCYHCGHEVDRWIAKCPSCKIKYDDKKKPIKATEFSISKRTAKRQQAKLIFGKKADLPITPSEEIDLLINGYDGEDRNELIEKHFNEKEANK